jgi:hypothetical protein
MSELTKKQPTKKFASILLVESVFIENPSKPQKNFTGIPLDESCPFIELVFDPEKKILGIVSKHMKPQFHYVPKIDGNGFPKPNSNKAMQDKQPFAQERLLLDTYHEYYIRTPEEIEFFLNMYVVNKDFDWKQFLK